MLTFLAMYYLVSDRKKYLLFCAHTSGLVSSLGDERVSLGFGFLAYIGLDFWKHPMVHIMHPASLYYDQINLPQKPAWESKVGNREGRLRERQFLKHACSGTHKAMIPFCLICPGMTVKITWKFLLFWWQWDELFAGQMAGGTWCCPVAAAFLSPPLQIRERLSVTCRSLL